MPRICVFNGCCKHANFAFAENNASRCKAHIETGMIDVNNKRCTFIDCNKQPVYGFEGNKPCRCKTHAEFGMMDVNSKRCSFVACKTRPSYGFEGQKPCLCKAHAQIGMVDVVNTRCIITGCNKIPNYAFDEEKPSHCKVHAEIGMVDNVSRRCRFLDCNKRPSYGFEGQKSCCCKTHAEIDMVDVTHKSCKIIGCNTRPGYGFEGQQPTHCKTHVEFGMVDVRSKRCMLCPTHVKTKKYRGYCIRCFMYTFPDIPVSRNYKVKERHIHEHLESIYKDQFTYNKQISNGCSRRIPDWFFECYTHSVIVECDEEQHEAYDTACDNKRTMEIFQDLGNRPIVFIRFNPDKYTDRNNKKHVSSFKYHKISGVPIIRNDTEWNQRLETLTKTIDHHVRNIPNKEITNVKLFFDA
jgi:very-short-patch-repair endonuclease